MADSAVTSSAAPCAPPPQIIIGRLAAPSRLAARRIAATSIFGGGTDNGCCTVTGADRLQTSIVHSIAAGPGRPMRIAPNAKAVAREASRGLAMRPT
jgi:hypothetical protein